MRLTYRGNAYEVLASIHSTSNSENQPKQKLMYRGQTYDYTPPAVVSESFALDALTVTLIYRGVTFERQIRSLKPYQMPRATSWRYRMLGEG